MREPEIVLLDWSEPTADGAAKWLLERASPGRPADLSGLLVLVPTRGASRRLRSALARHALKGGVLSPRTTTPSQWLVPAGAGVAQPIDETLAALSAMESLRSRRLPALFPEGIPFRSFDERLRFAESLQALRSTLADGGHSIRSAARALASHPDADRWADLAVVEDASLSALKRAGLSSRESARLTRAVGAPEMAGVRGVVLVGIADLQPLAAMALGGLPETVELHALVPGRNRDDFDAWGRPLAGIWENRDPGWENFEERVRLCARAEDAAEDLLAVCPAGVRPDGGILEIGLLDRDVFPAVNAAIESRGGAAHDPDGESLAACWLSRLLGELAAFLESSSCHAAIDLLRNGAFAAWLRTGIPKMDHEAVLREADMLLAEHFPSSVFDARNWCGKLPHLRRAIDEMLALRERLSESGWRDAFPAMLDGTVEAFHPALDEETTGATAQALEVIDAGLAHFESWSGADGEPATAECLLLIRLTLESHRYFPEATAGAISASGWLELQWSAAPHLVLTGFNNGLVPGAFPADPFLRQSVRDRLGLPTEAQRGARDAYFLTRLLAQRAGGRGRVDVQVLQFAADGSPRQPSRLLFAGAAGSLPARVERLFEPARSPRPEPAWTAGWTFDPRVLELPRRMRVTGFAGYLDCPFEFYLRFGLGMEPFDGAPSEMDARVFGSLVHNTLEAFARDGTARDLVDPGELRKSISDFLDEYVAANFSVPLSLALLLQVESARRRLHVFADAQAAERRAGWRIERVEVDFEELLGRPWIIDDWEIRGRIDRIDIHEKTGARRLLDYKTSDRAETPAKMHLRRIPREASDWPPDYARIGAKERWIGLQIPLYRQVLIEAGAAEAGVESGYFNLPKAVSATGVSVWEPFGEELAESAMGCARGVLADVGRGRFWPPNAKARYPQLAEWFEPGADRVISGSAVLRASA